MQTHSPDDIAARTPADFRGAETAHYVDALRNTMPMFSPDGMMSADGAESVHTVLARSIDKVRNAHIDLAKTYTNDFIHQR
jgi:NitT/TauT family transport system substrate-binding protein